METARNRISRGESDSLAKNGIALHGGDAFRSLTGRPRLTRLTSPTDQLQGKNLARSAALGRRQASRLPNQRYRRLATNS